MTANPPVDPDRMLELCPGVLFRQRLDLSFEFVTANSEESTGIPAEDWLKSRVDLREVIFEADWPAYAATGKGADDANEEVSFRVRHRLTGRISRFVQRRRALRDAAGSHVGWEGVWIDVTLMEIAARQLDHAAWYSTFGQTTMGAFHDLNNKLTGILSFSDLYLSQVGPDHPFQNGLSTIKETAQQASRVLNQLAALFQAKAGHREYIDLNEFIGSTAEFLRSVVPSRIRIEAVLFPEPLPLRMDPTRFKRVLIQIALEAAMRMPQCGTLTFQASRQRDSSDTDKVWLQISDEGHELPKLTSGRRSQDGLGAGSLPASGVDQLVAVASEIDGSVEISSTPTGTRIAIEFLAANIDESAAPEKRARPWVLVATEEEDSPALGRLIEGLRARQITPVIAARPCEGQLDPDYYAWDAVLIHASPEATSKLVKAVRALKVPAIVYLANGDLAEIDPAVADEVELAMAPDLSTQRVVEKIAGVLK